MSVEAPQVTDCTHSTSARVLGVPSPKFACHRTNPVVIDPCPRCNYVPRNSQTRSTPGKVERQLLYFSFQSLVDLFFFFYLHWPGLREVIGFLTNLAGFVFSPPRAYP
ncbi:hypothetical protein LZ30DRAFT_305548 [Colletotrichum cereale]|nr:hypothetical protein LZ30DRAFT_305548 [Colletotrichum cereale]